MKQLPTYIAVLSALLVVLGSVATLFIVRLSGVAGWRVMLGIIPIALIIFLFALVLGYFLTEPLRSLQGKIKAYRAGDTTIPFEPEGRLKEADDLSADFKDLLDTAFAQSADLARREKQQMQFVSDVAHELRTPLTAIHGNAELMLDPDMPRDMHDRFCHTIISESERLGRLTNDLLSLQKIDADHEVLEMRRVDLRPLVQEAVDALMPVLQERQANIEILGEAPDVLGNADRLKQVVSNLVDNASRFVEPGGHIAVELYGVGDNSVIAVKDDGPGFGDVDPQMLFERFFRSDFSRARNTGGSGLGLAIVKSIVEQHDGTVDAFTRPEGGACFIAAIPSV